MFNHDNTHNANNNHGINLMMFDEISIALFKDAFYEIEQDNYVSASAYAKILIATGNTCITLEDNSSACLISMNNKKALLYTDAKNNRSYQFIGCTQKIKRKLLNAQKSILQPYSAPLKTLDNIKRDIETSIENLEAQKPRHSARLANMATQKKMFAHYLSKPSERKL